MNGKRVAALCMAGLMTASVFTGCGANTVVATSDTGIKAEYGLVNFMCRYQQAYSADMYSMYYGITDWEDETYDLGSSVVDNVTDTLHDLLTIEQHASEIGVELTDEEKQTIADTAAQFISDNDAATLKELGATEEIVERYLTLITLRAKANKVIIAGADTEVSDEEANMSAFTMLEINIQGYTDYSTYSYVEYTEDEIAQKTQDAKDIFAAITAPEDLETVAEEYGYTASSATYDADDTSLDETVKTTLDGLNDGEMSGLIETDSAYYIVRMDSKTDEEATEENRQSIIETRQDDLYTSTIDGWEEEDGWKVKSKKLSKISFKNSFTLIEETEASTEETTAAVEETTAAATEAATEAATVAETTAAAAN